MVIAVANLKGGCCKTTTAMLLAEACRRKGLEAVVYDADPQGSAWAWADDAGEDGVVEASLAKIKRLRRASGEEDVTIIDCPPDGTMIDAAVDAADLVLIPTMQDASNVGQAITVAGLLERSHTPHAVLLCCVAEQTITYAQAVEELGQAGVRVLETVIPRREAIRRGFGQPLASAKVWGYDNVAEEVLAMMTKETAGQEVAAAEIGGHDND